MYVLYSIPYLVYTLPCPACPSHYFLLTFLPASLLCLSSLTTCLPLLLCLPALCVDEPALLCLPGGRQPHTHTCSHSLGHYLLCLPTCLPGRFYLPACSVLLCMSCMGFCCIRLCCALLPMRMPPCTFSATVALACLGCHCCMERATTHSPEGALPLPAYVAFHGTFCLLLLNLVSLAFYFFTMPPALLLCNIALLAMLFCCPSLSNILVPARRCLYTVPSYTCAYLLLTMYLLPTTWCAVYRLLCLYCYLPILGNRRLLWQWRDLGGACYM